MDPTEDALIEQINNFIDAHGYKQDIQLLMLTATSRISSFCSTMQATATSKSAMGANLAIWCL